MKQTTRDPIRTLIVIGIVLSLVFLPSPASAQTDTVDDLYAVADRLIDFSEDSTCNGLQLAYDYVATIHRTLAILAFVNQLENADEVSRREELSIQISELRDKLEKCDGLVVGSIDDHWGQGMHQLESELCAPGFGLGQDPPVDATGGGGGVNPRGLVAFLMLQGYQTLDDDMQEDIGQRIDPNVREIFESFDDIPRDSTISDHDALSDLFSTEVDWSTLQQEYQEYLDTTPTLNDVQLDEFSFDHPKLDLSSQNPVPYGGYSRPNFDDVSANTFSVQQ